MQPRGNDAIITLLWSCLRNTGNILLGKYWLTFATLFTTVMIKAKEFQFFRPMDACFRIQACLMAINALRLKSIINVDSLAIVHLLNI